MRGLGFEREYALFGCAELRVEHAVRVLRCVVLGLQLRTKRRMFVCEWAAWVNAGWAE